MSAQTRVARGAALLDEVRPDWFERIDRERLDLLDTNDCVLGQLYGSYSAGLSAVGFKSSQFGGTHGFVTLFTKRATERAWVEEITLRTIRAIHDEVDQTLMLRVDEKVR